jgi:acetyltransferase-like isoleucine patch superfamily enzyme
MQKNPNFEEGFNVKELKTFEGNIRIHPDATIGKGSSIGEETLILNATLGTVNIGENCVVGNYTIFEDNVTIGDGTRVWHYCHLRKDVNIGKNCNLGDYVFIDEGVELGDEIKIQNYVPVYHGVEVEDGVFFGPNSLTTNDMFPRSRNTEGGIKSQEDWVVSAISIGKDASIGAGATLRPGIRIGEKAIIGAGATVVKDVPPGAIVVGNPAKVIKYIEGYEPK